MNLIHTPVITFNKDYLVSCCICRFRPEELLMDFIAHVSFNAFMNGSENGHQRDASMIVEDYNNSLTHPFDAPKEHWPIYRQCTKTLSRIQSNKLLTTDERKVHLYVNVKVLGAYIKKKIQFVDKVVLADGEEIKLAPGFIVVCFVLGLAPEGLLNYFINEIKIIKAIASGWEDKDGYNPAYHFFTDASDIYGRDGQELDHARHYVFLDKMKKLHAALQSEPDYQKRLSKLNALANKWCKALKDVSLEKMMKD